MRNITVSVDEDLYRRARVTAAEQGTTLTALVRDFLERVVREDARFERLRRQQEEVVAEIREAHPNFSAGQRLSRDDAHERDALR